ncbi:hypothetical protein HDU86_007609 [Geranomyces michiganensis]|nr:hypothetical protein HDU86_007609 [Geranomyces michiganensis]
MAQSNSNPKEGNYSLADSTVTLDNLPTTRPHQAQLEWEPFAPLRVSPRVAELVEPFSFVVMAGVYSWLMVAGVELPNQLVLSTATIPGFVLLGFAVLLSPLLFLHLYIKYGRRAIGSRYVSGVKKPVTIVKPELEKAKNAVIRLALSAAAALCAGYGRTAITAVLATLFGVTVTYWYFIDSREATPGHRAECRWRKPVRAINVKTGRLELMKFGASYAALPSAALINAESIETCERYIPCACDHGQNRDIEQLCFFYEQFGEAARLVCVARAQARILKCKYLYVPRLDDELDAIGIPAKRTCGERKALIDSTRALRFKHARAVIVPVAGCPAIASDLGASLWARKRPWYQRCRRPRFSISVLNTVGQHSMASPGTVTPACASPQVCWDRLQSEINMQVFTQSSSLQELMWAKLNVVVFGNGHHPREQERQQSLEHQTPVSTADYCNWVDGLRSRLKSWRFACAGSLYTELVRRSMNNNCRGVELRSCLQELRDIYATRAGWIDMPVCEDAGAFRRLRQAFSTMGDTTLLLVPTVQLQEAGGAPSLILHSDSFPTEPLNLAYDCILKHYPEYDTQGQRVLILVTSISPLLFDDDRENANHGSWYHHVCGRGSLLPATTGAINDESSAPWYISPAYLGDRGYLAFQLMTTTEEDAARGQNRDAKLVGVGWFDCKQGWGVGETRAWNIGEEIG